MEKKKLGSINFEEEKETWNAESGEPLHDKKVEVKEGSVLDRKLESEKLSHEMGRTEKSAQGVVARTNSHLDFSS